ncbi:hypothetical protein ACO0K9_25360 [Undibacterium sp. Ji50W]|uniref:hypothetical protein n=1 Tax=Undibacterium sp. Ji50W TaxID=3413041 RepID=UPI003BF40043
MSKPFIQRLAILMLVIFMTNLGAWNLSSTRIKHELEHDGRPEVSAASHQHAFLLHDKNASRDAERATVEHQMLHAVDHLQFFPDTTSLLAFHAPLASAASWYFTQQTLPFSTYDTPYRPPCGEHSLA